MYLYRFTVFTPTYNRAQTLERLYRSLQQQTVKNFEWLVVDDGSTDETKLLFEKWCAEKNDFPICYHLKKNGGKHTAINFGLDKAQGELFFTADSDDFLTPDALQKVNLWIDSLPKNQKFCCVVGNMGNTPHETSNTIFDGEFSDADFLNRYPENSIPIDGERAYVFFTEIHKKYKYPVFEDEKFMTEAVAWNRMAHGGYKMRVYNDIIYIYKYLPNGLTLSGSKMFTDNPKGYALWLTEKAHFSNYTFQHRLKMIYAYYNELKHKLSKKQIAVNMRTSTFTVFLVSCLFKLKNSFTS